MEQMLKEERAEKFPKELNDVPIRPDDYFLKIRGKAFAAGNSRKIFDVRDRPEVVMKMAFNGSPSANWIEYVVWSAARLGRWKSVLAAVESISETGNCLIMERLAPLTDDDLYELPSIPYWLNDLKKKHFGRAGNGQIKVCDYGVVNLGFDLDEAVPYVPSLKKLRMPGKS